MFLAVSICIHLTFYQTIGVFSLFERVIENLCLSTHCKTQGSGRHFFALQFSDPAKLAGSGLPFFLGFVEQFLINNGGVIIIPKLMGISKHPSGTSVKNL